MIRALRNPSIAALRVARSRTAHLEKALARRERTVWMGDPDADDEGRRVLRDAISRSKSLARRNPARAADVFRTLKKHGGMKTLGRDFTVDVYKLARQDKASRSRRGRNRHDRQRDRRAAAEFFRLQDAGLLRAAEDFGPVPSNRPGSFAAVDVIARRRNPRKRKGSTMARSAAQRRAFKKMLAGLRKFRGGKRRRRRATARPRKSSRRTSVRRRRARVVLVRTNPKHRSKHMARRHRRRRRGVTAIMVNPRRRRSRRRFRMRHGRRRNPGFGAFLSLGVPAVLTSGALALADTKLMAGLNPMARGGIKLAIAVGAGFLLRKRPELSRVVVASIISSLVYEQVIRMTGGVAAPSSVDAAKQLKSLILEDPVANRGAMGVLVEGPRMGAYVDENVNLSGPIDQSSGVLPPGGRFQDVRLS